MTDSHRKQAALAQLKNRGGTPLASPWTQPISLVLVALGGLTVGPAVQRLYSGSAGEPPWYLYPFGFCSELFGPAPAMGLGFGLLGTGYLLFGLGRRVAAGWAALALLAGAASLSLVGSAVALGSGGQLGGLIAGDQGGWPGRVAALAVALIFAFTSTYAAFTALGSERRWKPVQAAGGPAAEGQGRSDSGVDSEPVAELRPLTQLRRSAAPEHGTKSGAAAGPRPLATQRPGQSAAGAGSVQPPGADLADHSAAAAPRAASAAAAGALLDRTRPAAAAATLSKAPEREPAPIEFEPEAEAAAERAKVRPYTPPSAAGQAAARPVEPRPLESGIPALASIAGLAAVSAAPQGAAANAASASAAPAVQESIPVPANWGDDEEPETDDDDDDEEEEDDEDDEDDLDEDEEEEEEEWEDGDEEMVETEEVFAEAGSFEASYDDDFDDDDEDEDDDDDDEDEDEEDDDEDDEDEDEDDEDEDDDDEDDDEDEDEDEDDDDEEEDEEEEEDDEDEDDDWGDDDRMEVEPHRVAVAELAPPPRLTPQAEPDVALQPAASPGAAAAASKAPSTSQPSLFEELETATPSQRTAGRSGTQADPAAAKLSGEPRSAPGPKPAAAQGGRGAAANPQVPGARGATLSPQPRGGRSPARAGESRPPAGSARGRAKPGPKAVPGLGFDPNDRERLIYESGRLFLAQGRVAVSMLQKTFGLDFKTSTEVMDACQERGLIGPYQGGQSREILMSEERWEAQAAAR